MGINILAWYRLFGPEKPKKSSKKSVFRCQIWLQPNKYAREKL